MPKAKGRENVRHLIRGMMSDCDNIVRRALIINDHWAKWNRPPPPALERILQLVGLLRELLEKWYEHI